MSTGLPFQALLVLFLVASSVFAQERASRAQMEELRRTTQQMMQEGRYAEGSATWQKIYDWTRQNFGADHLETADAAFNLGKAYFMLGDYNKVEPLLTDALRIIRGRLGANDSNVAAVLNSLGGYYDRMGQLAGAEDCYNDAIRILSALRAPQQASVIRYNMATMHRLAGLGQRAYAQRLANPAAAAKARQTAAASFQKARELLNAEIAFINTLRRPADDFRLHNRQSVMGEVCLDTDDFEQADRLFAVAKEFADRTMGQDLHGRDMLNLALSRTALGRFDDAVDLSRKAVALAEQRLGEFNPHFTASLASLARSQAHMGKWEEAARAIDRCLRIDRQYVLQVLPAMSDSEQLSFLFRPGYNEDHLDIALAMGAASNGALAEKSAEWAINGKAISYELLADRTLLGRDQSNPRTSRLASDLATTRTRLASLLTRLNNTPENDPGKRVLLQQISQLVLQEADLSRQLGRAGGRPYRPNWIDLTSVRKALPAGTVLVEIARVDCPTFGRKGAGAIVGEPRYIAWIIPPDGQGAVEVVNLGEAARVEAAVLKLREAVHNDIKKLQDQVLAEANQKLTAFATANKLQPTDAAFVQKLQEIQQALPGELAARFQQQEQNLIDLYRRNAADCAAMVLHPLAGRIAGAKQLLLSPDAHLWLVPWGALAMPDGKYLTEKCPVSYVVSSRDLLIDSAPPGEVGPPLVMGDIDYDMGVKDKRLLVDHPVGALKNSVTEIRKVAPLLKTWSGAEAVVLSGQSATEARFKAAVRPKALFLSTHASFSTVSEETFRPGYRGLLLENPLLRCGLCLAGVNRRPAGQGDDGQLYGIEVLATDLRGTQLVVLSACQTALGDVNAGQGAAGLRQAFQLAGAKAVAGTLWSVDDAATTTLTVAFFENLAAGQPKAQALRTAQLKLLAEPGTRHPYFWAPFTLTETGVPR